MKTYSSSKFSKVQLISMAANTIFDCCEQNDTEGLKRIIQSGGAMLNAKNFYGETPLYVATLYCCKECLQLLLEYGAEINAKDYYGYTPLHVAAFNNSKECLQLLLEYGAEINAKNDDGETPLDLIQDETFRKEMVEYANALFTLDIKEPSC